MKKRILTVLIAIITVIPFVLITPKAEVQTSTHTITSYGDYTFQQGMSTTTFNYELPGLPINLTWNSGSYMKLDYNFKDKYSGSMKLTVTSNQDWVLNSSPVYWSVSGDGVEAVAYISATTTMSATGKTKTFSIIFSNCTGIHFNVATGASATFFTSSNSITISNATFTTQADLNDIYLDMRSFHNSWDTYIPGMSTNLSNIVSNTSTMASDIAIIKGFLDELEGYTDNIEPLLNQLININKIASYPIWQQNALFWANKMGSLQFDKQAPYFYYDSSLNIDGLSNPKRIKIDPNKTVSLIFYCDVNVTNSNFHIYGSQVSNVTAARSISSIVPTYPLYLIRLDFTSSHTTSVFISIEFDNSFNLYPLFLGDSTLIPDDIHILFGTDYDNTYTRLLQQISNGVNGVYDTSQYEQYEQTIDGLNDNMRDIFNSSETSFQNNINNILTPDQTSGGSNTLFEQFHFNAINGVFTVFLGQLFNAAPVLQYLLLFGLLLLVLGVFI